MQYPEAIDYLYSRLPVFHRIGPKAIKPGLTNILRLCEALGNPQHKFQSIHVAGTNGKGSTSHMLAAVYQSAGYRVGLYTSPHLKSFTERIRINGQPIPEAEVAAFVDQHRELIEDVEPSFFEVTVAMAFAYFAEQNLDVAIIEVGLGGRLDSTNIITPLASVITNIGYDHTDILGDTLPQIAGEKAGIIKPNVPVIVGETHPETAPVFRSVAAANQAPITFADQHYQLTDQGLVNGRRRIGVASLITPLDEYPASTPSETILDLIGLYQLKNLAAVLATVSVLQEKFPVTGQAQQAGLGAVARLTGLLGRFQILQESPRVIADTAHNQAGLMALLETVRSLSYDKLRIVIGLVSDKDREKVLSILPNDAAYYFCQAQSPRALPANQLQQEAINFGKLGESYPDVNTALFSALQMSTKYELILVTGSNYIVAELDNLQ
ncbi:bifunctional folylpolyglutamate synthase/dihydrofolate synthase [Spirosoma sp. KUDC1026]|uniref:bifunctional folylpolyglutamate synthase/dihydrofolate synthase n=1 Tax=Spirosoma sp. KUDC1026 TaxID=2745947 RepID=UPI00159BDCE6|nr:folylpolyglutamate synthase/dihydrofolate synthase family protein [Spirosoma sp. KUDC1026]QKZ13962.1 bifunctional folylpolyglutamate synthase/dihydrofolate synthase [Spirosoma sp. KUDC1026]